MLIKEVFDQPVSVRKKLDTPDEVEYQGMVDSKLVVVTFLRGVSGDDWELQFGVTDTEGSLRFDATGDGNSYAIFALVLKAIQRFIKERHPDSIDFAAAKSDEDFKTGRAKLYARMVKRFSAGMGYAATTKDLNDKVEFILKRQ